MLRRQSPGHFALSSLNRFADPKASRHDRGNRATRYRNPRFVLLLLSRSTRSREVDAGSAGADRDLQVATAFAKPIQQWPGAMVVHGGAQWGAAVEARLRARGRCYLPGRQASRHEKLLYNHRSAPVPDEADDVVCRYGTPGDLRGRIALHRASATSPASISWVNAESATGSRECHKIVSPATCNRGASSNH